LFGCASVDAAPSSARVTTDVLVCKHMQTKTGNETQSRATMTQKRGSVGVLGNEALDEQRMHNEAFVRLFAGAPLLDMSSDSQQSENL